MSRFDLAPSPQPPPARGGGRRFFYLSPTTCLHCNLPAPRATFLLPGMCRGIRYDQMLGLGRYYARRMLDPTLRAPRPEAVEGRDMTRFTNPRRRHARTVLAIDGLQCGACVWLIESVLAREPDVLNGRVNMTTRRLRLVWRGAADRAMPSSNDRGPRLPPRAVRCGLAGRRSDRTAGPCCVHSPWPASPPAT